MLQGSLTGGGLRPRQVDATEVLQLLLCLDEGHGENADRLIGSSVGQLPCSIEYLEKKYECHILYQPSGWSTILVPPSKHYKPSELLSFQYTKVKGMTKTNDGLV